MTVEQARLFLENEKLIAMDGNLLMYTSPTLLIAERLFDK